MARMGRPQHNTTSLPRHLRSELGIRDTYSDKKRKRTGPAARKDRRRDERAEKKSRKPQRSAGQPSRRFVNDEEDEDDFDLDEDDEEAPKSSSKKKSVSAHEPTSKLKSALKKPQPKEESESDESDGFDDEIDLDEPEEADAGETPNISSKVKSKLDQDDAEIAALEKKLGLKKGGKLPKAFAEDGLDELMGDLGDKSDDENKKRKREADEWLLNKRRKAQKLQAQAEDEDSEEESDDDEVDLDDQIFGEDDDEDEDEDEEDEEMGDDSDFGGFDEEDAAPKKRENPYVAPAPKATVASTPKYIPPSLRGRSDSESESLTRLKRQAQGHLNKLSEANLISILGEFEKLYRDYPRQHVTSTIIDLLMGLICERAVLQDTFLVLHAGFIAALYKIMGMDFGAEIVQKVVETLDAGGDERGGFEGKEVVNLVSLLSQLYNFHVIGSPLMFDYIRLFLQEITEANTELLLKVIRSKSPN